MCIVRYDEVSADAADAADADADLDLDAAA